MGVASIFLMRKRIIVKKMERCGAISKETAKTLTEAGIFNPNAFPKITEQLVRDKVLVKTDNKYYLNR